MTGSAPLSQEAIARLTVNTDPWLSCDDCFDHVDIAVEGLLGSSIPLTPEFRAHLRGCAACREEAQALAALVADEFGMTAAEGVGRLDGAVATAH